MEHIFPLTWLMRVYDRRWTRCGSPSGARRRLRRSLLSLYEVNLPFEPFEPLSS